jgi:glycosyltransferase involved in cell wall biosynthesis
MNMIARVASPALRRGTATARGEEASRVRGKFFFRSEGKHFLRGVTYGPFAQGAHGAPFPDPDAVARDFTMMREARVNTVRVFIAPPLWLLDRAEAEGLQVLVGLPWPQHASFLDSAETRRDIGRTVADSVRGCRRHEAVFAYLIGNEISPDIIRWHGAEAVRRFLQGLADRVRDEHAGALVSYANFPSTEYLTIDFTDFLSFNVYLHNENAFRRYIAHLHNLAVDRPLVLTEFGIDSLREGAKRQSEILSWQVRAAFESGVAGTFVFSWTDEWFTGGYAVEDWAFGLVDRERRQKPALAEVAHHYRGALPPPLPRTPRVSVVVCAYNAERTLDRCLASLAALNYPDYEVILVNDGSRDRTLEIAKRYPFCQILNQTNKGLGVARNVGAATATGEIVAYTDSDCVADPDWLTYLVAKMESGGLDACGGPNLPPPENGLVAAAVALAPGGPTHVLLSDEVAEHIAGCNMAFRRQALEELGGFDPIFRAAGDDVDICWRFQDKGSVIGFSAAAVVWHFRRNTVGAYLKQQRGYGKAEALVYAKHPLRFNLFGQAKWLGRVYGDLSAALLFSRRPVIYSGVFGRGLFQTLYESPSSLVEYLPLSFEWGGVALLLAGLGIGGGGYLWLLAVPLLITWAMCLEGASKAPLEKGYLAPEGSASWGQTVRLRALVALLIYLGPLLRGWERVRWRLKEKRASERVRLPGMVQRARIFWGNRAFTLSYWSEEAAEKEALITRLMDFLLPQKYFVVPDNGWSGFDLKIARGLSSRALVTLCCENHGGSKRLFRVRCAMRLSRLARFFLRGCTTAAALALILGWPVAAVALGALGLVSFAAMALELGRFGGLMHRILDAVAADAGLTALSPLPRCPLPITTPRTV